MQRTKKERLIYGIHCVNYEANSYPALVRPALNDSHRSHARQTLCELLSQTDSKENTSVNRSTKI